MSLIVTVKTNEGIVMASDSRTTRYKDVDSKTLVFPSSDTTYKTFSCNGKVGISTCGSAHIGATAIAGHIENFANNNLNQRDTVDEISEKLLDYFLAQPDCGEIIFHVAGYDKIGESDTITTRRLVVGGPKKYRMKKELIIGYGCAWDGEGSVLRRLMKAGYEVGLGNAQRIPLIRVSSIVDGKETIKELPDRIIIPGFAPWHTDLDVDWDYMSLQDGIDFAKYAIQTTIDTMKFQSVAKTVGGPIDILTMRPGDSTWIAHKTLHA